MNLMIIRKREREGGIERGRKGEEGRERERGRDRDRDRETERCTCTCKHM